MVILVNLCSEEPFRLVTPFWSRLDLETALGWHSGPLGCPRSRPTRAL